VDVNNQSPTDSYFLAGPPLYSAAAYERSSSNQGLDTEPVSSIVQLPLDKGANVNIELDGGTTLLHECLTFEIN
jgi:hypothetical protein